MMYGPVVIRNPRIQGVSVRIFGRKTSPVPRQCLAHFLRCTECSASGTPSTNDRGHSKQCQSVRRRDIHVDPGVALLRCLIDPRPGLTRDVHAGDVGKNTLYLVHGGELPRPFGTIVDHPTDARIESEVEGMPDIGCCLSHLLANSAIASRHRHRAICCQHECQWFESVRPLSKRRSTPLRRHGCAIHFQEAPDYPNRNRRRYLPQRYYQRGLLRSQRRRE